MYHVALSECSVQQVLIQQGILTHLLAAPMHRLDFERTPPVLTIHQMNWIISSKRLSSIPLTQCQRLAPIIDLPRHWELVYHLPCHIHSFCRLEGFCCGTHELALFSDRLQPFRSLSRRYLHTSGIFAPI